MARIAMLVSNDMTRDARVRKSAAAAAAAGHDVVVFAVRGPGLAPTERIGDFEVRRVAEPQSATGWGPLRKAGNLLTLRRMWRRFAAEVVRNGFDLVHANDLDTLPAGVRAARATGARLVYDAHELFSEAVYLDKARSALDRALVSAQRAMWERTERRLIGRADLVVTVNDRIAAELATRYGIAKPLVVLNAPEADDGSRTLPLPPLPGVTFIYQGGLISDRGLPEMLEAFARVPEASLVVMGSGELKGALAARATLPDLADRVRVVDPVPPSDVVAAARAAAAGLIPFKPTTLNNRFASPNKLFDYLHAHLAIVASDLPFIASVVRDCGCGVLVAPGDVDALAAALRELATDPARLSALRAASAAAAPRYTWEHEGAKLTAAYARLLGGASAAPGGAA